MTTALSTRDVSRQLEEAVPGSVVEVTEAAIIIDPARLPDVAAFLKDSPHLDFDYLSTITAVDYYQYFEVSYFLVSLRHNHSLMLKARCHSRDNPSLPSLTHLWRSADLQEREVFDLMGITFEGHPNLKRIVLWPGFQGHPLRKDYL